nr:alpha-L-rhamnosidase C-terminal domain-containing protein [Mucilaginibacter sp. SP1R1]
MELTQQRLKTLRKSEGINVAPSFPAIKSPITIPAHTTATLLLDQAFLTNAYPTILFSGGKNSTITLNYEESLFTKYPVKGNRNEVENKVLVGIKDVIIPDGQNNQEFTSRFWRTYRYIAITIVTNAFPLVLEDVYGTFTGFPFVLNAQLNTNDAEIRKIFEIGWRTARLCAFETYMDCPYYEQLQYIGDTRIQALVSLFNSGDDRLVRNAINDIEYSKTPEGLTMSRYPSSSPQYIPPFSLWYIGMLHDYMMYGKDTSFLKTKLMSERQVLNYFSGFQQPDGSVKNIPWWNFSDWVDTAEWSLGTRSFGKDGSSALLDLQLLWAYQLAADMELKIGLKGYAEIYTRQAEQLQRTIRKKYWDAGRYLLADRPEKDLFSQHTNALAILTGTIPQEEYQTIGRKLLNDTTLTPASIYFKYYLHQALTKAGFGGQYLSWLGKWRENIHAGLTTWAETSDVNNSRSDCHAWGASPNIEFFRTLLGIDSDSPGFATVKIEPHLGVIESIGGEMPHPNGKIKVQYTQLKGHLKAVIGLPSKTTGKLIWKGKNYLLKEGLNTIQI